MGRRTVREPPPEQALSQHEKDQKAVQDVWDLIPESVKQRVAQTESDVSRFSEYFGYLCYLQRRK